MPKRNSKGSGITRRQFLGASAATGISAFLAGLGVGRNLRPNSNMPAGNLGQKSIRNNVELKAIEPEEIIKREKIHVIRSPQKFKIFRPGLKGEEFARAYGVRFTTNAFDLRNVPPELVHDIKILVAEECRKYNSSGVEFVDPHEILAVIEHESHYNPNARGKAGDAGFGQLMPSQIETLKNLPEHPITIIDPFDPVQNIEGIVRTFLWLKQHPPNKEYQTPFRRWAAYNRGRGSAKSLGDSTGNHYANKILVIWNRLNAEKAL